MSDSDLSEAFVAKFDAFAASLKLEEQTMLVSLLTANEDEDEDVIGFGHGTVWPGLVNLGIGHVASTAGGAPDGLVAHELTHVIQQRDVDPRR